jgi:hypothetical protein
VITGQTHLNTLQIAVCDVLIDKNFDKRAQRRLIGNLWAGNPNLDNI